MQSFESARVAGVLLAAGLSRRMGRNKLLIELGERSVVRRAAETAAAAGFFSLLVVVGHQRERVESELAGIACKPVFNPDSASGIHTSLRAGLAAVPESCEAAVVMLADMPLVSAAMLRELVERFRGGAAPLVISTYDGVSAPPILYSRALFPELCALETEDSGRRLVHCHRAEALELAWPAEALTDLDLPEDLERVRALLTDK